MSLPRHAINRLAALHYVGNFLLASSLADEDGCTEDERARYQLLTLKLNQSYRRALEMEPPYEGNSRYRNTCNRAGDVMERMWTENVDAVEAVTTALARIAEEGKKIPRRPELLEKRLEWAELETLLQALLELLNPPLDAVEAIEKGCQVADRMAEV